jgi:general stress protein 26
MDTPNFENLQGGEAAKKIKELAEAARTCMMITKLQTVPLSIRPMATQKVDEQGNVYFLSVKDSDAIEHINASPEMTLTYSNDSKSEYLALHGKGEVYRDQAQIDDMWNSYVKTWFPEGKEDPNIMIIRFSPESGHYWDTQHGKVVQLLGMVYGAVTGKETDDSLEGELNLNK